MTDQDIADELTALRAVAETISQGPSGWAPATQSWTSGTGERHFGQCETIAMAMQKGLNDNSPILRRKVLAKIFPTGLVKPVESTRDLSKAQANALIRWLYDLEAGVSFGPETQLSARAVSVLLALKRQVYVDEGQLPLL